MSELRTLVGWGLGARDREVCREQFEGAVDRGLAEGALIVQFIN